MKLHIEDVYIEFYSRYYSYIVHIEYSYLTSDSQLDHYIYKLGIYTYSTY